MSLIFGYSAWKENFWFNNNIYVYFKYVGLLSFEHVNRMPAPFFVFWISLTNRLLQVYQFNFLKLFVPVFSNTHECFEIILVFTRVYQYPWIFWNYFSIYSCLPIPMNFLKLLYYLLVFTNTHEFFEITLVFTRVHQYPWFFWNYFSIYSCSPIPMNYSCSPIPMNFLKLL